MPVSLITTPGAGVWTVPGDCPAGTVLTVETWGAGSGGSGRVGSTFGSGGGAGAYASNSYTVTLADIANGIPYVVGAGSAGTSGANPAAAGFSSWGTNNIIANTTNVGAVVGAPGTLPTGWIFASGAGLTTQIIGIGTTAGLPYIDIQWAGTTTATTALLEFSTGTTPATVNRYTMGAYFQVVGGATTGLTSVSLIVDAYNGATYLSSPGLQIITMPTGTLTRASVTTSANPATTNFVLPYLRLAYTTSTAINLTLRIAGLQMETGTALTPYTSSSNPGCALADGGAAPAALVGGAGGTVADSLGSTIFAGGAGASYNAAGAGGGGSAGKDGIGAAGTTAGVGGQGDLTTGGLGGAVKTTTPGNAGTANTEGGGGGGALKTVAGTGGAGGYPGGGGGSAAVATGTGGAGANGQIRLTYTSVYLESLMHAPLFQIWA